MGRLFVWVVAERVSTRATEPPPHGADAQGGWICRSRGGW